jgi:hypothetical protein
MVGIFVKAYALLRQLTAAQIVEERWDTRYVVITWVDRRLECIALTSMKAALMMTRVGG